MAWFSCITKNFSVIYTIYISIYVYGGWLVRSPHRRTHKVLRACNCGATLSLFTTTFSMRSRVYRHPASPAIKLHISKSIFFGKCFECSVFLIYAVPVTIAIGARHRNDALQTNFCAVLCNPDAWLGDGVVTMHGYTNELCLLLYIPYNAKKLRTRFLAVPPTACVWSDVINYALKRISL